MIGGESWLTVFFNVSRMCYLFTVLCCLVIRCDVIIVKQSGDDNALLAMLFDIYQLSTFLL